MQLLGPLAHLDMVPYGDNFTHLVPSFRGNLFEPECKEQNF